MANEGKIDTAGSIAFAVQSMVDIGISQLNLLTKGLQSLVPVIGTATRASGELAVSSLKAMAGTAAAATTAVTTIGGSMLNAALPIVALPFRLLAGTAGIFVSVTQSGIGLAVNTVNAILPPRKI